MVRFDSGLLNCTRLGTLTKCFLGCSGSLNCTGHWWDEDVTALTAELESLKNHAHDSDSIAAVTGATATVSELVVRKKNEVAAITEVSVPVC